MRNIGQLAGIWVAYCLLAGATTNAADITASDGTVYRNVTVTRTEPDGIAVTYQPEGGGIGMAKLKFPNLPENLQREYGYNEQKATAFEAEQVRVQAAIQAKMLAADRDAADRLAQRLAREDAQWQADRAAANAKLRAQQLPRGGGGGGIMATPAVPSVPITETRSHMPPQTPQQGQTGRQSGVRPQTPNQRIAIPSPVPNPGLAVQQPVQLNGRSYGANSLGNPYGAGSPYKPDGLMNPYSQYGSPYSPKSWNNPYATDPPQLYKSDGTYLGKWSANPYDPESTSNPYGIYGSPFSAQSINNPNVAGSPLNASPIYVVPSRR